MGFFPTVRMTKHQTDKTPNCHADEGSISSFIVVEDYEVRDLEDYARNIGFFPTVRMTKRQTVMLEVSDNVASKTYKLAGLNILVKFLLFFVGSSVGRD